MSQIDAYFVIILFIFLILLIILLYYYPELGLGLAVGGAPLITFVLENVLGVQDNLAMIIYSLTLIGLFISFLKNRTFLPIFSIPSVTIFVFVFVLILGTFYSPSPKYGFQKVIIFSLRTLFPFFSFLYYSEQNKSLKGIFSLLLYFGIILGIISTIQIFTGGVTGERFGSLVGNSIKFSRVLGVVILLLIYKIRYSNNKMKIILIACLPFLFLPMLVSGSRGPMLALGSAIALYMLLTPGNVKIKIYSIAIISISIILIYNFSDFKGMERIKGFFEGDVGDGGTTARLDFYSVAWNTFLDSPLFGIGTGGFGYITTGSDTRHYPHNIFLEVAAENGIIGLSIMGGFLFTTIFIVYFLLFKIDIDYESKELIYISITLLLFALVASLTSGDIAGNQYVWFGSAMIWGQYSANRKINLK